MTDPAQPVRIKGIVRNEPNKCWLARINRRRWQYAQYFWDNRCGGKEAALREAQDWYNQMLAKLPAPLSSRDIRGKRNKSGVVGVNKAVTVVKRMGGTRYFHWVGRWDGRLSGKRFSILKYGDEGAFVLACVARALQTMDDAAIQAEYELWRRNGRAAEMIKLKREAEAVEQPVASRSVQTLTA